MPSDMEATRVWRDEQSGVFASGPPEPSAPDLELTVVFPLERRLPPQSALGPAVPPPAVVPARAREERSKSFAISVATFAVMAVVLSLTLPWVLTQLP